MELIKAKYAQIDKNTKTITLYEEPPESNGFGAVIENAIIEIGNKGILHIRGEKWNWGFRLEKTSLSDIDGEVVEHHLKYWYESIKDWIKKIKKPYVNGWFRYKKNTPFDAKFSQWALYYEQ